MIALRKSKFAPSNTDREYSINIMINKLLVTNDECLLSLIFIFNTL